MVHQIKPVSDFSLLIIMQCLTLPPDEQEEQAMRFDLDLCYFGGNLTSEFNFKDQTTGQEISEKNGVPLLEIFKNSNLFLRWENLFFSSRRGSQRIQL